MKVTQNLPKTIVIFSRHVTNSYWFLPTIMAMMSGIVAYLTLAIDSSPLHNIVPDWAYFFTGGPSGARDVIGVIAGSIITVAGVTFSISIVVLSLAAQQYGSRLLRNFTRDRSLHFIMGTFIATFVYNLLILPSIHTANEDGLIAFVPRLSVTICILSAIFSVFVLIYFIHHVSLVIQASYLSSATNLELLSTLKDLYPAKDEADGSPKPCTDFSTRGLVLTELKARTSGYFQAMDAAGVLSLAKRENVYLDFKVRAGDFLVSGDVFIEIWGGKTLSTDLQTKLLSCVTFGGQRTIDQDPSFGFDMLVEMAVRALSPGINDPFTAMQCIGYVREGLQWLASWDLSGEIFRDANGIARVNYSMLSFGDALERTIPVLHYYAKESPIVLDSLKQMLEKLSSALATSSHSEAVDYQLLAVSQTLAKFRSA